MIDGANGDLERDAAGRFVPGNAGGPGRPRRAIERDYLTALSDECGPDVWRRIVQRAVADAEWGNATARVWLAKYLLPETRPGFTTPLMRAALDDALDIDPVIAELEKRGYLDDDADDGAEGDATEQ